MVNHLFSDKNVFTVAQLNRTAKEVLEQTFQQVWVQGELSNVVIARSGHIYFTLKDAQAQINCAMFKGSNRHLAFTPTDGMQVLLRASVSIYEARGDYQLIVSHLEKSGLGQLQQAFEALKAKLQAEGLFDVQWKKSLPRFPAHVGIVTSHTGAAIQDILSVLKRRFPIAEVTIFDTAVQGKTAAANIVKAINLANQHKSIEVLILARGGGSLEDLWCFNEEIVARAIFASRLPIVTGVGHEVDFTIADFVADRRAPTPSVAAETITPDTIELIQLFEQKKDRITKVMVWICQRFAQKLDSLEKQLLHPGQRLQKAFLQCDHLEQRLKLLMSHRLDQLKNRFSFLVAQMQGLSPLATLARGYAIVKDNERGEIVRSSDQLHVNQVVHTQLGEGSFVSTVLKISSKV